MRSKIPGFVIFLTNSQIKARNQYFLDSLEGPWYQYLSDPYRSLPNIKLIEPVITKQVQSVLTEVQPPGVQ